MKRIGFVIGFSAFFSISSEPCPASIQCHLPYLAILVGLLSLLNGLARHLRADLLASSKSETFLLAPSLLSLFSDRFILKGTFPSLLMRNAIDTFGRKCT